jgi:predicted acylesterase/phospholipase RssA
LSLTQKDNNVTQPSKNNKHRALILSGGGALGAYQVGVLKILSQRLMQEDREKREDNRLLFDIVAGTSIGAMNGAVLVSKCLQTKDWQTAIDELQRFWTDREEGLASTVSEQDLENEKMGWKKWYDESKKENPSSEIASAEAARRYYSVKHYFFKGAPKVQETSEHIWRDDFRFFDSPLNKWYLHKSDLLAQTIQKFAQPYIATSRDKNEPRFLVFAVDAAEGETVTFDSYAKADGSRRSEYGNYRKGEKEGYENVIIYDKGVSIDHIMASGTLPEFYYYKVIDGHKFWDGGLLSNTPFREFLQAHKEYLANVMLKTKEVNDNNNAIPELEVYIVNLHPSKQKHPHQHNPPDPDHPPERDPLDDRDGVKDRHNDIIYGDRSSHYDEKQTHLIGDLQDFVARLKSLSIEAISKLREGSDKEELKKELEEILTTPITSSRHSKSQQGTYNDLPRRYYKLTKVVRIERTKYEDSIYGKAGDFSYETIQQLIKEGMDDATQASLT